MPCRKEWVKYTGWKPTASITSLPHSLVDSVTIKRLVIVIVYIWKKEYIFALYSILRCELECNKLHFTASIL